MKQVAANIPHASFQADHPQSHGSRETRKLGVFSYLCRDSDRPPGCDREQNLVVAMGAVVLSEEFYLLISFLENLDPYHRYANSGL